ncbi:sensor histidine kinase [Conchiformibius kuhniae]|uniref:histidine kinase n=1 Tax=Conchiformibius kuhniae TaxID=211502 RepID=A0A8T9MUZ7_9NEIS|nr:ATP-binding protein [Conchiformibius kuhniae]UOP05497.1 ATP-binding protein [Conchiformibius kuhniae]
MQRFFIYAGITAFLSLYALTFLTGSNHEYSVVFWAAFVMCAVLTLILLGIIFKYIVRIVRNQHRHIFGSQIARKLSAMFATITLVPMLCMFAVSMSMIQRHIDSWFTPHASNALDSSVELGKRAIAHSVEKSLAQAGTVRNGIAAALAQEHDIDPALLTKQAQAFEQLAVVNLNTMRPLKQTDSHLPAPPPLDATTLTHINRGGTAHDTEHINHRLYAHGWLKLPDINGEAHALFFRQTIPESIAAPVANIEKAYADHAAVLFAHDGMKLMFGTTLLISSLMALLFAIAAGLYFAQRFIEPILHLAAAAKAVSRGDFQQRLNTGRKDEFGRLANLFNHMSEKLAFAQAADAEHRRALEASHHYLERVLESLSSGVITLDSKDRLKTYNRSAEMILDLPLDKLVGRDSREWVRQSAQHTVLAETVRVLLAAEPTGEAVELAYAGADETRTLLGKAVRLPAENGNGTVLIFDNITTLVLAQKEAAWGEVAKRLAHEIRNPLTPIQLSAERLAHRLRDKLDNKDEQFLTKSTNTIIKQVAALKEMVEAFRNYARAPSLKLHELELNQLVSEVLVLYESSSCTFTSELSNIPLWLKADTTAMRQVLHNLLKNASEAAEADPKPHVCIRTHADNEGRACLSITNNGKSFSNAMLQTAFEPYTTDKASGTGLGLSVVKRIVEDHHGSITLANGENGGACVHLKFTMENP